MAIAPFRPALAEKADERRRTRFALAAATLGIAAALLAYAISPGVRHAVSRAEHSVRHAVSRVFDHDTDHAKRRSPQARRPAVAPGRGARGGTRATGATTSRGIVRYATSGRR
jgi:hypothetical protein